MCEYYGFSLKYHIEHYHTNVSLTEYKKLYGETISLSSKEKYRISFNQRKYSPIEIFVMNGGNIEEIRKKQGETFSKNMLENIDERKRRSELLGEINKRPASRQKASETAKKTSKRKDILHKRTQQLREWRENNTEEFYKKCVEKLVGVFYSVGEKRLYEFFQTFNNNFERNRFIKSKKYFTFSKTNRKQIDFLDKDMKVMIEFDGPLHFQNKFDSLDVIKHKDKQLERFVRETKKYMLIRISQKCLTQKYPYENSIFKPEVLDKIISLLQNIELGKVFYIGKEYGENNILC